MTRDGARARRLGDRRLDFREAARVVERAEARFGVEFGVLRRNAVVALREDDVAGRDRDMRVGVRSDILRVDLGIAAAIHFDMPDPVPVFLVVADFAAVADRRLADRLGRRLRIR